MLDDQVGPLSQTSYARGRTTAFFFFKGELARQAAARQDDLRIMFITGFAAVALAAGDRAPAGAKVLSKPIHLREIVAEVERMMAA